MSIVIENFRMPNEIKGRTVDLKRVNENDTDAVKNICEALFYGKTTERIKKTMAYFSKTPEDVPSLISTLNQCFDKNGFNYFIFRGEKVIGQIYGFPYGSGVTPSVSIWGWISDKALRQGYMKQAVHMVENEHFVKTSDSLEIYIRVNPVVEAFMKSIHFKAPNDKHEVRSYYRHREEWLKEQDPRIIAHHDGNIAQNANQYVRSNRD